MTPPTERRAKPPLARSRVLLPAFLFCLMPLCISSPAGADTPQNSKNTIDSIRTIRNFRGLSTYDITLTSSAAFPMDDSVLTLSIGGKEFINSTYAPGGTMNTLVFSLTRAQFQSLKSGVPVVIYDGADNAAFPEAQWNFGALDLSLLDRTTPITLPVTTTGGPVQITTITVMTASPPVEAASATRMTAAIKTMTGMTDKTMTAAANIVRKGTQ